jgi:DNA polymerase III epsilon subunit-like protein
MANRDFIVFDFETGGRDPMTCQPTQLAAVALDGRTLKKKGEFQSMIKPILDDEKAIEMGLGPVEQGALDVTGQTREELAKAPELKATWMKFVDFVNKFNWKKTSWFAPIAAGYNINNYDIPIVKRLCKEFGQWDKKKNQQTLFNLVQKVDVMDNMFMWTENDPDVKSISMDNLRDIMGLSKENAHDALQDVKDTANIMISLMKTHRTVYRSMKLEKAFAGEDSLYVT